MKKLPKQGSLGLNSGMGTKVVDNHLAICEELLQLLNEENRKLKKRETPEDDLLEQKRGILTKLDTSLADLKALHEQSPELMPVLREKLQMAQNKIMRIILLDRENEQLLLKAILPSPKPLPPKRSLQSIKGIYEKHRIPES